jgi:hypothetical protein
MTADKILIQLAPWLLTLALLLVTYGGLVAK